MTEKMHPALAALHIANQQKEQRDQREQASKTKINPAYLNLKGEELGNRETTNKPNQTNETTAQQSINITRSQSATPAKPAISQKLQLGNNTVAQQKLLNKQDNTSTSSTLTRVDISIAGTSYRINCPREHTSTLQEHSERLNKALRDIRSNFGNKNPSNEELLVLHCLALYDELHTAHSLQEKQRNNDVKAEALIERLIKQTKEVL